MTPTTKRLALNVVISAAVATVAALVAVRAAQATAGGASPDDFTFAGTLTDSAGVPLVGAHTLTFRFHKGAEQCDVQAAPVVVDGGGRGAFRVRVNMNECGGGFFDGNAVTFDVAVDGNTIVTGQPVGAVPYAKYADHVGSPDCPVGYSRVEEPPYTVCERELAPQHTDVMVKVGTGASAFWIDRYEATLWAPGGSGSPFAQDGNNYPVSFTDNGQIDTANLGQIPVASSVKGHRPSSFISWFQAQLSCRGCRKAATHQF